MEKGWVRGGLCAVALIAGVLAVRDALGCVVCPPVPPSAQRSGRSGGAVPQADDTITITGSSPRSNKDTSIHVVWCWDQGTPQEQAVGSEDAAGTGTAPKTKTGITAAKIPIPQGAGPTPPGHHVLTWAVIYDKDGTVTWVDSGTYSTPY